MHIHIFLSVVIHLVMLPPVEFIPSQPVYNNTNCTDCYLGSHTGDFTLTLSCYQSPVSVEVKNRNPDRETEAME